MKTEPDLDRFKQLLWPGTNSAQSCDKLFHLTLDVYTRYLVKMLKTRVISHGMLSLDSK